MMGLAWYRACAHAPFHDGTAGARVLHEMRGACLVQAVDADMRQEGSRLRVAQQIILRQPRHHLRTHALSAIAISTMPEEAICC